MDGDSQLSLEDFALGDRFRSPDHTLGEAHFLLFAGLTGDNRPIHCNEDYARQTRFGAHVAHGLLVMAMLALGASPLAQRLEASMIAFLEQGCRFRKAVGDTVHAEFEVAERLAQFSCKGCGFCPSCGARRMTERAAHLVDCTWWTRCSRLARRASGVHGCGICWRGTTVSSGPCCRCTRGRCSDSAGLSRPRVF